MADVQVLTPAPETQQGDDPTSATHYSSGSVGFSMHSERNRSDSPQSRPSTSNVGYGGSAAGTSRAPIAPRVGSARDIGARVPEMKERVSTSGAHLDQQISKTSLTQTSKIGGLSRPVRRTHSPTPPRTSVG